MPASLSIVLPAKNEAPSLRALLPELKRLHPLSEIIVVNDGSTDDTSSVCKEHEVLEIRHPYSMGNGAAIKSGARGASGELIVFMDADGQHRASDIAPLLKKIGQGYDMVVGARSSESQASWGRLTANAIYNKLASLMTGHKIDDLTSGFRAVRATHFREFLHLLPNGFSYPTTITMAFFRAGYRVAYLPIIADKREGKSHINITKDGIRFFLIIFKVGTLYSPLKIFMPFSALFFLLGFTRYLYTLYVYGSFTNMSALLLTTSLIVFLIGLVSEQITTLIYQESKK